jgi:hypothetical protein
LNDAELPYPIFKAGRDPFVSPFGKIHGVS